MTGEFLVQIEIGWHSRGQQHGHQVILIPPQYVKPFVKGNKNDFNDALAITEAALRPDMISVPLKSIDQQAMLAVHRIREGFVTERTAVMSRMGSLLLEFGLALPKGHKVAKGLFAWLAQQSIRLSPMVIGELQALHDHYLYLNERIALQDEKIRSYTEASEQCVLLQTIPGIG